MGLFDSLFNRRDREIQELMNPALAMKLREFVIVDDDPNYVKHYFKFRNKEGADEEFITVYRRVGSPSPNATATLRIECGLTSFEANRIPCSLRLNFRPFQIERTTTLVMALFTEELKGGLVEVQARPIPQDARSKLLDIALNVHEDDVPKCLNALCAGTPFCFGLIKPVEPSGKSFLDLPPDFMVRLDVPNDLDFKRLYEQSYAQIERSHEATRARHLREGWYRRRAE
jgi:hypothetical protein